MIDKLRRYSTLKQKFGSRYYDKPLKILDTLLRKSIKTRVLSLPLNNQNPSQARVSVLYSGGLDCSCICALLNEYLPPEEEIELINVSFKYDKAPDRKTALEGLSELKTVFASRKWSFIKSDITFEECDIENSRIELLSFPNNKAIDKVSNMRS